MAIPRGYVVAGEDVVPESAADSAAAKPRRPRPNGRRGTTGTVDCATAFAVIEAAEMHRYPAIIVENAPEFQDWALYP